MSNVPIPFAGPRHDPKKSAFEQQVQDLMDKGAVERVQKRFSPGFYSNLFLVQKASGGYHPVINLKPLNRCMVVPKFKMETIAAVIKSVRTGDWTVSIDFKGRILPRGCAPFVPEVPSFRDFAYGGLPVQGPSIPSVDGAPGVRG